MIVCLLIIAVCVILIIGSFHWEKCLCRRNRWPYEPEPWNWAPWWRWRTWLVYALSIICLVAILGLFVCVVKLFL